MSKKHVYHNQAPTENEEWQENTDLVEIEEKSKSQVKREMLALQALGAELVAMPAVQLAKVPMSEKLRDNIELCQRITAHGGRDRQLQFIGRIMRDEEMEPLHQALEDIRFSAKKQAQKFHVLERWRERLIADGDSALSDYLVEHPDADRQQLRTLIRQAQKEAKENKAPSAARELFKVLRGLQEIDRSAQPDVE